MRLRFPRWALVAAASLSCLLGESVVAQARAQEATKPDPATYSLSASRQRLVTLAGSWRFQPGDNPEWARPEFDDSRWALMPSDRAWPLNGTHNSLNGFAWYRFRVEVPVNAGPLAIELPRIRTSYQLFADGELIGSVSRLPLEKQTIRTVPRVYPLPNAEVAAHTVTFALRVWHRADWSLYFGGGPSGPARIGDAAMVERDAKLVEEQRAWGNVDALLLTCLEALAGFTALGLLLLRAKETEYLWFSLMLLLSAAGRSWLVWQGNHIFSIDGGDNVSAMLFSASGVCAAFFYLHLLKASRTRLFWLAVACLAVDAGVQAPVLDRILSIAQQNALARLLVTPFFAWIVMALVRATRKGVADVRLLLFPVLLQQVVSFAMGLSWVAFTAGWQTKYSTGDIELIRWPFTFTLLDATDCLYLVAVLAILVSRFARTSREQDRVHADLEAARTLQHVLIPTELPPVPGFSVATAYRPAQEVGGDFFQIIPLAHEEHGQTLAVIGDVAGKGLPAAMTVSLLVGALRTLAETKSSPAEILAGLNRRLIGRGASFSTAMVLLLRDSGEVVLANAGHLAPYWNGQEIPTEAALPLGLDEDAEFCEVRVQLRKGDRLTLLTDGVPEATCRRELFGFERTALLSTEGAEHIADEAVRFGQQDDITVLSLIAVG